MVRIEIALLAAVFSNVFRTFGVNPKFSASNAALAAALAARFACAAAFLSAIFAFVWLKLLLS